MRPDEETEAAAAEIRILAIEAAHPPGSLALAEGSRVVDAVTIEPPQKTTAVFAVEIQQALRRLCWKPTDIQLVATTTGPGSFTGTRIGVTAAKVFAYAARAEVCGVNTLDVIAAQQPAAPYVRVFLDAQRQQLFTAAYAVSGSQLKPLTETELVAADELATLLAADAERWQLRMTDIHWAGPGLQRYAGAVPENVSLTAAEHWAPQARTLARLALEASTSGNSQSVWDLHPQYFRKSAAEEKAEAQARGSSPT